MSELVREPTDAEFSAMLDVAAPNREQLPGENVEEPVAEEPAVEETPEEVPELPEKYQGKSAAEIARMHSELEQRLGQQGSEVGALRNELAQIQSQLQKAPPEPAPWETFQQGTDALDEAVLTNPKDTLDWIQNNQPQLYSRAIATWANIDPFGASDYNTEKKLKDVRSEYEERFASVQAPVVASQNQAILNQAIKNVAETHPLYDELKIEAGVLLEKNPEFQVILENGDVASRERALRNLLDIALARRGLTQGATIEVPGTQTLQAKKIAATVASPGSSAERAGEKTAAQTLADRLLAPEGTSIADELARNRAVHAAKQAAR